MSTNYSILVDGYSQGNGSPDAKAGSSMCVLVNDVMRASTYEYLGDEKHHIHRFEYVDGTTNNIAEVLAVMQAVNYLKQLRNRGTTLSRVTIKTESANAIGWLSLGWKCKANPGLGDLVDAVKALLSEHPEVSFEKVDEAWVKATIGH